MAPIWLIIALLSGIALLAATGAIRAFANRRPGTGVVTTLVALVLAVSGLAAGTAAWAFASFRALTQETVAATIRIERPDPASPTFLAHVLVVGGEERTYRLAGDQVLVDAQIVKWHPWANALGLTTAYRLDRIAGRYRTVDDERTLPRAVESLSDDLPPMADRLFGAIAARPWLEPLVDAQYGSGTFVTADAGRQIEVRVSTSGLLMRTSSP